MDEKDKRTEEHDAGEENGASHVGLHNHSDSETANGETANEEIPNPNTPNADDITDRNGESDDFRTLKSAQSFATASCVCAAISLIIGGVLLSSVALVLGIVASRKLNRVPSANWSDDIMGRARRLSRTAFILSIAALALNLISLVVMLPLLSEYLASGDVSTLSSDLGLLQSSPSPSSGSKTWG